MSATLPTFDVMVFSGGGFKGAYGAGAAKALITYYQHKNIHHEVCFVGNSAGALNAAVMASGNVDDLIRFWLTVTREDILGNGSASFWGLLWTYAVWSFQGQSDFFSVFANTHRREFMRSRISFDNLIGRHLIVTATDFVFAQARAFYFSALMDQFKKKDEQRAYDDQRLAHCGAIASQEELLTALSASSAIPLAFPPVEIEYTRYGQKVKSYFVDGGVGNNVPTREAAYFLRFLEAGAIGIAGDTYHPGNNESHTVLAA